VQFCRHLRQQDFQIGPSEEADALKALGAVSFENPDNFRRILKAVLARNLQQLKNFDDLYASYWSEIAKAVDSKIKMGGAESPAKNKSPDRPKRPTSIQVIKNWLYGGKSEEVVEMAVYSPVELLTRKDFSAFSQEELTEVMQIIRLLSRSLATQNSRRFASAKSAGQFDVRQTLRSNMRRGGEILDLAFRKPKLRRMKIILLCDVSKSMDLYSRFLIQFMYGFQTVYHKIETFVFSTSLHRVTKQLRNHDFGKALEGLATCVPNWSAGTKIGASLQSFLDDYSSKFLDNQTIVLLLSDGWDTGELETLEESMRRIHRKANKVIWLNPLAGNPNYQPSVGGMQVAMPFIDVFAPAHNVESLWEVAHHLGRFIE
jgi:uncharacterized protein